MYTYIYVGSDTERILLCNSPFVHLIHHFRIIAKKFFPLNLFLLILCAKCRSSATYCGLPFVIYQERHISFSYWPGATIIKLSLSQWRIWTDRFSLILKEEKNERCERNYSKDMLERRSDSNGNRSLYCIFYTFIWINHFNQVIVTNKEKTTIITWCDKYTAIQYFSSSKYRI